MYRLACFFFSSRRRHTRFDCDWSSDVCSSDLAKSESPVSFHSPRLRSGMTDKSIISSCSEDTGGVACRFISPCVRNTGGSPTRRCRSDDVDCTSALSSSPRARSAPLYCAAAKSTVPAAPGAGASTIGAAAIAEGLGGRGGGAAGGGGPPPAGGPRGPRGGAGPRALLAPGGFPPRPPAGHNAPPRPTAYPPPPPAPRAFQTPPLPPH